MKTPIFIFDRQVVLGQLEQLSKHTRAATDADRYTAAYYAEGNPLLWIDAAGADHRADTLLARLHTVAGEGLAEAAFFVPAIERDLQRLRTLDVDDGDNSISRVAARLDYRLTQACLRYALGQRFGFVNPQRLFNHLDKDREDTVRHTVIYRELFDVVMDHASREAAMDILEKVRHDSIDGYLRDIQPRDSYYRQMKAMLAGGHAGGELTDSDITGNEAARRRIVCNMERGRWRRHQPLPATGKHVVVNIPAQQLYALGGDSMLTMRIACGAKATKTPLLSSEIEWMEVNPQWVIPTSIVKTDVARHAGDTAYFARNRYRIIERATNQQQDIASVSRSMLLSGKYRVAQESGAHNSLGQLVLRFKNRFSVFLHYTSNPSVFRRESRMVSHGCVRVEKPFELAQFVLTDPDEWLLERMRIAMDLKPQTERGIKYVAAHTDEQERKRLVGYVPVKPHVPIYIIYNTLWPDENGVMQTWPDIYGYDEALWKQLQKYMQ